MNSFRSRKYFQEVGTENSKTNDNIFDGRSTDTNRCGANPYLTRCCPNPQKHAVVVSFAMSRNLIVPRYAHGRRGNGLFFSCVFKHLRSPVQPPSMHRLCEMPPCTGGGLFLYRTRIMTSKNVCSGGGWLIIVSQPE